MSNFENLIGIFRSKHHPEFIIQITRDDELFEFILLSPKEEWLFKRKLEFVGTNTLKDTESILFIEFPDEEFNFFDISKEPVTVLELIGRWERIADSIEEIK